MARDEILEAISNVTSKMEERYRGVIANINPIPQQSTSSIEPANMTTGTRRRERDDDDEEENDPRKRYKLKPRLDYRCEFVKGVDCGFGPKQTKCQLLE